MNWQDSIFNFIQDLKNKYSKGSNDDTTTNNTSIPPIYVVRSPSVAPNSNPSLAMQQPKIERDLVKVGDLPTMSESDYNKSISSQTPVTSTASNPPTTSVPLLTDLTAKYEVKNNDVASKIYDVAQKFGIDPELMFQMAHAESRFDPGAINKKTKATGLYQILPSTLEDIKTRLNKDNKYQINDPTDPVQNATAAALYVQDTKRALSKIKSGDSITAKDIYLAHFSGPSRAIQVLKAIQSGKGTKTADKFYSPDQIQRNRNVFYNSDGKMKTLQQVYDTLSDNMFPEAVRIAMAKQAEQA